MNGSFLPVLGAGLLSCFLCSLGILTISKRRQWAVNSMNYFMYFASGVLLSAAFLIVAPKAFELNTYGPACLLGGFLGIFLIDRFIDVYVCHRRKLERDFRIGVVAGIGIAFHSLVDGVIYSTTYTVFVFLGIAATLGMIFHEFPEGIITFTLFEKSGFKSKRSFLYAFLAAAATTPIGAVVSFSFISSLNSPSIGVLLGLSAGVLTYVGAAHLLPEAEREGKRYGILAFAVGVFVGVGLWLTKVGLL